MASSNDTPCFRRLETALFVSHSNTIKYIQNDCRVAVPSAVWPRALRALREGVRRHPHRRAIGRSSLPPPSGRRDPHHGHCAAARVLQPRHRDDAVARASSRKRPPPAGPAFALRASAFHLRQGYGGQVARATADKTAGKLLRIHVERFNPALRLYERRGFRQIDDRGVSVHAVEERAFRLTSEGRSLGEGGRRKPRGGRSRRP